MSPTKKESPDVEFKDKVVVITGECENFLRDVIRPVSCVQWK